MDLLGVLINFDPDENPMVSANVGVFGFDEAFSRRYGVEEPPEPNEAWLRYRQSAIWGLVIGWLITPTENYGEEITAANISRLVTAVQDLETFEALV